MFSTHEKFLDFLLVRNILTLTLLKLGKKKLLIDPSPKIVTNILTQKEQNFKIENC